MSIWVRNFRSTYADADAFGRYSLLFYLRELLQVAGYTEESKSGTGWDENVVATLTDCVVLAASPRVIYSPSAPFTVDMVDTTAITFLAANEENRSIWRIKGFIDASHVEVDAVGFPAAGWVDESGITARLTRVETAFASTAQCLMNSPVSKCRVKLEHLSAQVLTSIHPTAQLGDVSPYTDTIPFTGDGEHLRVFQMFADDGNVVVYWNTETYQECLIIGQLEDVDTGDAYPWVMFGKSKFAATEVEYAWHLLGYCVDQAKNPITAYITWLQPGWGTEDTASPGTRFGRRLVNGVPGYAVLREPWVALEDRAGVGSGVRGKLPWVYVTNSGFEPLRPLDTENFLHWYGGLVVPRNGANDSLPLVMSQLIYNPAASNLLHTNVPNEIRAIPRKSLPVPADIVLAENSEDGFEKVYIALEDVVGSGTDINAIHRSVDGEIATITEKTPAVGADILLGEDSADGNSKVRIPISGIPHQSISGAGTNSHSTIDSHIGSTLNPHSVTKAQVSLTNVTDDAQLKRAAGDFAAFTEKTSLADNDKFILEDFGDGGAKKWVSKANLVSGSSGLTEDQVRQVCFSVASGA
jgi:hypothetical protein